MKRLLILPILFIGVQAFGQILDQFNYTGLLESNGWTSHSGTAGQFQADNAGSLVYPNLPTSVGNKANYVAGNGQDLNKAITITSDSAYYSLIINLPNTTGLSLNTSLTGDNFFGFGQTAGGTLTIFGGQLRIRSGVAANTFQLALLNTGAATLQPTFSGDLPAATPIFVVVKVKRATNPVQASMWINPTLGLATEPAPTMTSTLGTSTFTNFASIYVRQAGTAGAGTGNIQIDEIRVSNLWTQVTPNACATASNLTVTNCGPYTLNGQTYTTTGNYSQVLAHANSVGCDSTIFLNLTVKNPTTNNLTVSNCGPYTLNGQTYSSSGSYTQVLAGANSVGCDSTINLTLSIVGSITYYQDSDNDGLGNPAVTQSGCAPIAGYVTNSNDCDDNNNAIGAATTWYIDADNDGFGGLTTQSSCTQPVGYVANNTDCNDANPAINPNGTEIPNNGIDEDCLGGDLIIAPAQIAIYEFTGNDCAAPVWNVTAQPANATFSLYNISGTQTCAQAANVINYSGWNMTGAIVPTEYYGFTITPAACYALNLYTLKFTHRASSGAPTVTVRSSLDNFQSDIFTATPTSTMTPVTVTLPAAFNTIYGPVEFRFYITTMGSTGATYRHDNVSVEGFITALTTQTYYADADGDSFGDPAVSITDCVPPAGYVSNNLDCNDNNAAEFPGAVWYQDSDIDGLGNPSVSLTQCSTPAGYVSNSDDCDDTNNTIGSGITYYEDLDNDGFGNNAVSQTACTQPVGYVANNTDCDDNDNAVGGAGITYYADSDSDGYGDATNTTVACTPPVGYVLDNTDCDDANPATYPGAIEVCDGEDNNCDNNIDEGLPTFTWYADADNDGRGNPAVTTTDCQQPAGYVGNSIDCDDTNPAPTAGQEIYYADTDNDNYGDPFNAIAACEAPVGYILQGGDCNDTVASINPGATDVLGNGIDENCDGVDGYLSIVDEVIGVVTIMPNPGVKNLTIEFANVSAAFEVEVIAADGKILSRSAHETTENTVSISTETWMPGMYLVCVKMDGIAKTYRWIKQ